MTIEELFDSLDTARIEQFVADQQEENLHIEFKTLQTTDLTQREDKRLLAKALSGFANSSGGVVIWGIEAHKNKDGVDCAVAEQPIANCRLLVTRLNSLTGDAVSPLVSGVRHSFHPTTDAAGYAASFIPESESGPHMAKLGEDRFYKRSGDSFYRMEQFDIADMFGRRKRAHLRLTTRIVAGSIANHAGMEELQGKVVIGIENSGRAVARAPYLVLLVSEPYRVNPQGVDGNRNEGLPRLVNAGDPGPVRYGANTDMVIHPNTVHEVTSVAAQVFRTQQRGYVHNKIPGDVQIRYELAAEDVPLQHGVLTVEGRAIAEVLLPQE